MGEDDALKVDVAIVSTTFKEACHHFLALQLNQGEKVRTEVCHARQDASFSNNVFTFTTRAPPALLAAAVHQKAASSSRHFRGGSVAGHRVDAAEDEEEDEDDDDDDYEEQDQGHDEHTCHEHHTSPFTEDVLYVAAFGVVMKEELSSVGDTAHFLGSGSLSLHTVWDDLCGMRGVAAVKLPLTRTLRRDGPKVLLIGEVTLQIRKHVPRSAASDGLGSLEGGADDTVQGAGVRPLSTSATPSLRIQLLGWCSDGAGERKRRRRMREEGDDDDQTEVDSIGSGSPRTDEVTAAAQRDVRVDVSLVSGMEDAVEPLGRLQWMSAIQVTVPEAYSSEGTAVRFSVGESNRDIQITSLRAGASARVSVEILDVGGLLLTLELTGGGRGQRDVVSLRSLRLEWPVGQPPPRGMVAIFTLDSPDHAREHVPKLTSAMSRRGGQSDLSPSRYSGTGAGAGDADDGSVSLNFQPVPVSGIFAPGSLGQPQEKVVKVLCGGKVDKMGKQLQWRGRLELAVGKELRRCLQRGPQARESMVVVVRFAVHDVLCTESAEGAESSERSGNDRGKKQIRLRVVGYAVMELRGGLGVRPVVHETVALIKAAPGQDDVTSVSCSAAISRCGARHRSASSGGAGSGLFEFEVDSKSDWQDIDLSCGQDDIARRLSTADPDISPLERKLLKVMDDLAGRDAEIERLGVELEQRADAIRSCGADILKVRKEKQEAADAAAKYKRRVEDVDHEIERARSFIVCEDGQRIASGSLSELQRVLPVLVKRYHSVRKEKEKLHMHVVSVARDLKAHKALKEENMRLERAHLQQAAYIQALQARQAKVEGYKTTMRMQERVIRRLEEMMGDKTEEPPPAKENERKSKPKQEVLSGYVRSAAMEALREEVDELKAENARVKKAFKETLEAALAAKDRRVQALEEELIEQAKASTKENTALRMYIYELHNGVNEDGLLSAAPEGLPPAPSAFNCTPMRHEVDEGGTGDMERLREGMRQQAAKVPPYVLGGERRRDGDTPSVSPPSIIPPATVGAAYGQPTPVRAGSTGGEASPMSRRPAEEARGTGAESVDRWQRQLAVSRKKEGPGILASAPRHLGDGLVDGVGSILGGVAGGVCGLVALPVIGAKEEGVGGFFKGLGAGVLGAVVLPVTGAVSGVGNIVGGILNTPDTIKSRSEGKEWDPIQKKWVMYNLMEEAQRVLGAESSDASSPERRRKGPSRPGKVQDTHYYDVIGVAPEATADEIKRAYYKAARKVHPDKNPDDAEAHRKFQELSQAYQVLSNDQLRAAYDRDGREAASEVHFMDPTIFFNILFGSEKFEPYTGRLRLSDLVSAMGEVTKDGTTDPSHSGDDGDAMEVFAIFGSEKSLKAQNTRAVKCALHLVTLLDRYAGGDVEGFRAWAEKEAEELAKGAFGPSMLYEVGWAYENYAREYVGFKQSFLGVEGIIARSQRTGASMKKQADLSIATLGALKAAQSISMTMPKDKATAAGTSEGQQPPPQQQHQQQPGQPQQSPQQQQADTQFMQAQQSAFDSSLPVFLDAMWKLSAYDISETVFATCQKVLRDRSADENTRKKRAEGLLVLGGVFRRVGQVSMSKVERDAKSHLEEAMQKTMAHFQGQEL